MLSEELTERQNQILFAVIESFIEDGEPLGSRSLAKKYDIGVSPATIRNDMSDLEDYGFLRKAHSSSGRIPSDMAYRSYVTTILEEVFDRIDAENSLAVSRVFSGQPVPGEKVIESAAKILSDLTGYTIVSMIRRPDTVRIVHTELIPMDGEDLCLVNLYETGDVTNSVLRAPRRPTTEELRKLNFYLSTVFTGKNLADLKREIAVGPIPDVLPEVSDTIRELLSNEISEFNKMDINYEGLSKIFNFPEYSETDRAREFIKFVEKEKNIEDLFRNSNDEYLDIRIGDENEPEILKDNTVITSTYFLNNQTSGKIAVIAPKRMKYRKTIEAVMRLSWRINNMRFNY